MKLLAKGTQTLELLRRLVAAIRSRGRTGHITVLPSTTSYDVHSRN